MEESMLVLSTGIAKYLSLDAQRKLMFVSKALQGELSPYMHQLSVETLYRLVPEPFVRVHYAEMLGVSEPAAILERRGWLVAKGSDTQWQQWQAMSVVRLVQRADIDGSDVFCAVKRAYFASQVPALACLPGVILWMHVLGALEEQDHIQALRLAAEAMRMLVSTTSEENVIWRVQAAHFLEALSDLPTWMCDIHIGPTGEVAPSLDAIVLNSWLEALLARIKVTPTAGRYGPPGDPYQIRARHLQKVLPVLPTVKAVACQSMSRWSH